VPRIQTFITTDRRKQSLDIGRPANFPTRLYFTDTEPPQDQPDLESKWNVTV
jgi:hypothetical protein